MSVNIGFMPSGLPTNRIADALERIAAAMERAYPLDLRDSGLTRAWDDAEVDRSDRADAEAWDARRRRDGQRIGATLPDPNRCETGCIRPSLHGGDCDVRVVADPVVTEAENRAGD